MDSSVCSNSTIPAQNAVFPLAMSGPPCPGYRMFRSKPFCERIGLQGLQRRPEWTLTTVSRGVEEERCPVPEQEDGSLPRMRTRGRGEFEPATHIRPERRRDCRPSLASEPTGRPSLVTKPRVRLRCERNWAGLHARLGRQRWKLFLATSVISRTAGCFNFRSGEIA